MIFNTTDDVTMTIDPIARDHWIYDGSNNHARSQERGTAHDMLAMQRAMNWHKAQHGEVTTFMPTVRQLDVMDKFASKPADRHCPGFTHASGSLPVIAKQLYNGSLMNKAFGQIEHETREAERRIAHRLFDKSGYTR